MFTKLILLIFIVLKLFGQDIDKIKLDFINTTDVVVKIVKNKSLATDKRNEEIVSTITPMFDFQLMAKLSLGNTWKQMDKQKQNEFIKLYVKRMKQSYSSKIDKYTDEKIVVNNIEQTKPTRVTLNTSLIGKDQNLEVIYKYYKPSAPIKGKENWLVYDVVISGVSIIKTDRAQFSEVLKQSSIDELINKLR